MRRPRAVRSHVDRSAFAGFRFPPEVITVAVRWHLRYGLSYRELEELLAERGVQVDHVAVYRWAQRFAPLFADAARPLRRATGDRWFVDGAYVKVAGRWRYLYRAVGQFGQVIDVMLSMQRDTAAARRFFARALRHGPTPVEVTTYKSRPVPAGPGRTRPSRSAPHRAVRQQPGRSRSRPAEGSATAEARTQAPPLGRRDRRRTRPCSEPPPGTPRTRRRRLAPPAPRSSLHRARSGNPSCAPVRADACPGHRNVTEPSGLGGAQISRRAGRRAGTARVGTRSSPPTSASRSKTVG